MTVVVGSCWPSHLALILNWTKKAVWRALLANCFRLRLCDGMTGEDALDSTCLYARVQKNNC
jgi:hypothetical protein